MSKFGPSKEDIEKMIDEKVNAEHESNKKARRTIKAQLSKLIEKNESDIEKAKKKVKENSSRIQENANDIITNASNVATNSTTMVRIVGQLKM